MGHCYTGVVSDVLARWHRLSGDKVFFTTGTDEHGQKVEKAATDAGLTPQEYVDKVSGQFKDLAKAYNISNDRFVRTTDPSHEAFCKKILKQVYAKGDIYKGKYEGWYCLDCETYYTEKDLIDKKCPLHRKETQWMEEESYFFKMSKYQKKVQEYIKKQHYIFPRLREQFLLGRMKQGVADLSISRTNTTWGIPLPFDKKACTYVWFDALLSYRSATAKPGLEQFWPADVHLIAHDILWHHSVIWLSMLAAAGIKFPKTLLVHGFINAEGGIKMSKSLGNVIDPMALIKEYPSDSVRYFLIREIPFGADGSFSMKALRDRHNNELVNDLGNLQSRTLAMIAQYRNGRIPKSSKNELPKKLNFKKIQFAMAKYELHTALAEIWKFINLCNKYINARKPWELAKGKSEELDVVLYNLAESLRILSILLEPFIPDTTEKIRASLGLKKKETFKDLKFGILGNNSIKREGHLFTKIEGEMIMPAKKIEEKKPTVKKAEVKPEEHHTVVGTPISFPEAEHYVPFKDWEKMKFRVGKVTKIQPHPNADRLYVMLVDLGAGETPRQIVAGLRPHYKPEELLGKQVIVFTNLQPILIRGIESNGMLLAAEFSGRLVYVTPEKPIETGARIG